MDNKVFKAIGSTTRLNIMEILAKREMHVSGLAKELNISVPVAAKHVRILEEADLIDRRKFGKTHILRIKNNIIDGILDSFAQVHEVNLPKESSILDALKMVSGVEVKEIHKREFVVSIDGEQGLYMYEVNGKPPDTTVEDFKIKKDSVIEWKKLIPVTMKRIFVKIEA